MMKSWTVSLLRQTRPYLTLPSVWRYRDFLLHRPQGPCDDLLRLRMRRSRRSIYLRKWGSDSLTFAEVFLEHAYRPVLDYLRSCRTLIDVGANIGLATIYLSSHFGCRCFCVEPNPDTFRILEKNLSGGDAVLLNAGVWSSDTTLAAECAEAHYSMSTVRPATGSSIPGLPMPEILKRSGFAMVDLLKLDIEGAEVEVFKGDLGWLRRVNAIAIEFHGDSRRATRFDAVMREYGFRIVEGGHTVVGIRD